jgi:lipopolysaccharide export system permease protein
MMLRFEYDTPARKNAELTPFELIEKAGKMDKRHAPSVYLELHRRVSLPLLCILLILFGPPLAMMAGKSGRLGGLTIGLAVFTTYYMLLIYGENLVKAGKIPHFIGAWGAMVILGVFAMFLFGRESRR